MYVTATVTVAVGDTVAVTIIFPVAGTVAVTLAAIVSVALADAVDRCNPPGCFYPCRLCFRYRYICCYCCGYP